MSIKFGKTILQPNADGDVIELVNNNGNSIDNWSYVDEGKADDPDTNVGLQPAVPGMDLYKLPAYSGSGTIYKIILGARIFCVNPGSDYARIVIKTGGTVYYSGNLTTAENTWENKSYEWVVNPQTGIAWILNDINNLQIGIECVPTEDWVGCTQLYVKVYNMKSFTSDQPFLLTENLSYILQEDGDLILLNYQISARHLKQPIVIVRTKT